MTFDCTSMITLWRLDFTSPLYAGKYQTRTRRVMVQQEEYTRLQCNARYSVLVINYFYLRNYKCMKYKRCLLRYSGTRVHTSFYSMKGQRAFLLSPGWYAGSLQDKHTHTPPPPSFPIFFGSGTPPICSLGWRGRITVGAWCLARELNMINRSGYENFQNLIGWLKRSSFP